MSNSSNIFVKLDAQLAKEGYPRKERQQMILELLVYVDAVYVCYMYEEGRAVVDKLFALIYDAAYKAGLITELEKAFPYNITQRPSYEGTHWRAEDV